MVETAAGNLAGAKLIREGDDYPLFTQLVDGGHRFIVRSAHDRLLEQSWLSEDKLYDAVAIVETIVQRDTKLSPRKTRRATLWL